MHLTRIRFCKPLYHIDINHSRGEADEAVDRFRLLMHGFGDLACTLETTDSQTTITVRNDISGIPKNGLYDAAVSYIVDQAARLFGPASMVQQES